MISFVCRLSSDKDQQNLMKWSEINDDKKQIKMPKYKLRNVYKTLLQIWLFYYFLNTLKVYKCQQLEDVEFISATKNVENDVSDVNRGISDSEFIYEPVETIKNDYNNFDDEIEDRNKVNLNVNNNLHDGEALSEAGEAPSRFTEINEQEISGEKILYASESPFLLRQDLEVQRNAKLIVEPGVTVHFAPMVGITVHGQIKAIVSIPRISLLVMRKFSASMCQFTYLSYQSN